MPDYVPVSERLPSRLRRRNKEYVAELSKQKHTDSLNSKSLEDSLLQKSIGKSETQYCNDVTKEIDIEQAGSDDT